jgi:hypothetical protein
LQLKQAFWAEEDEEVGKLEQLRFLYMVLSFIIDTPTFDGREESLPHAISAHPFYECAIPILEDEELAAVLEADDLGEPSAVVPHPKERHPPSDGTYSVRTESMLDQAYLQVSWQTSSNC